MSTSDTYANVARDYADKVRALFTPTGGDVIERGGAGVTLPEQLANQADDLMVSSREFNAAAATQLMADRDPAARAKVSTELLAKAIIDLEASAYLLQAAEDEEMNIVWEQSDVIERGASGRRTIDELLQVVLGQIPPPSSVVERSSQTQRDLNAARRMLSETTEDVLALITERAGKTGQTAFAGLLGLGLGEIASLAGQLGINLAQFFGQAEKVTRLYKLFRGFVNRAYESLVTLLGPDLVKLAGNQVVAWIDEAKEAKFFSSLVDRIYETTKTQQELETMIQKSAAEVNRFKTTADQVRVLNEEYVRQIRLAEKMLKGAKFLGGVSAAVLPFGTAVMAAVYIVLCGYVVLTGADYVDAEKLKLLNRVSGVRQTVERGIAVT